MPAKSKASGLLPCGVEITPPRTVDLLGSDSLTVAVEVVVVVVLPLTVVTVVGTFALLRFAGGVAKLALIEPGKIVSSIVGSIAVL